MHRIARLITIWSLSLTATTSFANWTLGLGYHNPPNAGFGLNFLYFDYGWAFEIGLGWGEVESKDTNNDTENEDDSVTGRVHGGVNFKYFFQEGTFRPYGQIGLLAGGSLTAGKSQGGQGGVGDLYGGLGLMVGSPDFYFYGSFNITANEKDFIQGGIGFDII